MSTNKEKLLNIYEEAKAKRVVLNQDEFVIKLDYTRAHLFKNMRHIPDDLIQKAEKLLLDENFPFLVPKKGIEFVSESLSDRPALIAAIKVLTQLTVECMVRTSKKSYAEVSLEVEEMIKLQRRRIEADMLRDK